VATAREEGGAVTVNVVRAEADQVTVRVTIRLPMCVYLVLLRLSGQQGIGVQELIRGALLREVEQSLTRWGGYTSDLLPISEAAHARCR
jgi:hypothetical protein